jgi:hypothetical protein
MSNTFFELLFNLRNFLSISDETISKIGFVLCTSGITFIVAFTLDLCLYPLIGDIGKRKIDTDSDYKILLKLKKQQ